MEDGTDKRTENVIPKHPGHMVLWDWEANAGVDPSQRGEGSQARDARLASLPGWVWDVREALWEDGFTALIRPKEPTGHCDVRRAWGKTA